MVFCIAQRGGALESRGEQYPAAHMAVPLMELQGQWAELLPRAKQALIDVVDSGRYILGPQVKAFEEEAAAALGVAHGIGVANGTDALALALRAVGVERGDEVICPSYTFYATAEAIAAVGAVPCSPTSAPTTTSTRRPSTRPSRRGRARSCRPPVRPAGRPRRRSAPLCDRHGLALVEDAAQAFGAPGIAQVGDVATFSFFPTKNLSTFGDGGLITTPRADVADTCRTLRFHGSKDKQTFTQIGYNSRLDELHAAVLRVFLEACRAGTPPGRPPRRGTANWGSTSSPRCRRRATAASTTSTWPACAERDRVVEALPGGRHRLRRLLRAAAAPQPVFARPARAATCRDRACAARGASRCRCSRRSPRPQQREVVARPCGVSRAPTARGSGSTSRTRRTPSCSRRSSSACEARGGPVAVTARAFAQTVELARPAWHRPHRRRPPWRRSRAGKARAAGDRVASMHPVRPPWSIRRRPRPRLDRPADGLRGAAHPEYDDVRLRVRDAPALAQLPSGVAHARRPMPSAGPAAAVRRARRSSSATRASRRSTRSRASSPTRQSARVRPRRRAARRAAPPPELALYHRFANDVFAGVLRAPRGRPSGVVTVVLPRTASAGRATSALAGLRGVVVPHRALDGQSLVAGAHLVVRRRTINREAVVLGTPVYTTFAGRLGGVESNSSATAACGGCERAGDVRIERKPSALPPRIRRDPADLVALALSYGLIIAPYGPADAAPARQRRDRRRPGCSSPGTRRSSCAST